MLETSQEQPGQQPREIGLDVYLETGPLFLRPLRTILRSDLSEPTGEDLPKGEKFTKRLCSEEISSASVSKLMVFTINS